MLLQFRLLAQVIIRVCLTPENCSVKQSGIQQNSPAGVLFKIPNTQSHAVTV